MKTKNNYSFMTAFAIAAVSLFLLVPLRIYQYFKILEPVTGFYSKKDFSVYIVYALVAFVILFSVIYAFANKRNFKYRKLTASPVPGAVCVIIGAFGFIIDAIERITEYMTLNNDYSEIYTEKTKQAFVSENGGIFILLEAVFGIISAVYFFAVASGLLSKKNVGPSLRIVALALPFWSIFKLLIKFKSTISFMNVSELFLSLFATALTMLFLLYFAQTQSEVDKGATAFKMFAYGIPASVFSFACIIPRLVLVITGRTDLYCEGFGFDISDVFIALMIVMILIVSSFDSGKSSKTN